MSLRPKGGIRRLKSKPVLSQVEGLVVREYTYISVNQHYPACQAPAGRQVATQCEDWYIRILKFVYTTLYKLDILHEPC